MHTEITVVKGQHYNSEALSAAGKPLYSAVLPVCTQLSACSVHPRYKPVRQDKSSSAKLPSKVFQVILFAAAQARQEAGSGLHDDKQATIIAQRPLAAQRGPERS